MDFHPNTNTPSGGRFGAHASLYVARDNSLLVTNQYSFKSFVDALPHSDPRVPLFDRLESGALLTKRQQAEVASLPTGEKIKASARILMTMLCSEIAEFKPVQTHVLEVVRAGPNLAVVNFNKKVLSGLDKSNVADAVGRWAEQVQRTLQDYLLLSRDRGKAVRPNNIQKGFETGGVHCAVYLGFPDGVPGGVQWRKVGDDFKAKLGDRGSEHAEMKWKAKYGTLFEKSLPEATAAEFHISKVPCDEHCATEMIKWWKSLAPPEHLTAYIYTYADEQGGQHVYELQRDCILHLGQWTT